MIRDLGKLVLERRQQILNDLRHLQSPAMDTKKLTTR